jgi:hypothetical protein
VKLEHAIDVHQITASVTLPLHLVMSQSFDDPKVVVMVIVVAIVRICRFDAAFSCVGQA